MHSWSLLFHDKNLELLIEDQGWMCKDPGVERNESQSNSNE